MREHRAREADRRTEFLASDQPQAYGLGSLFDRRPRQLLTVGHVNGDALALGQAHDPGAFQRRGVHEDVLAVTIRGDATKPLVGVVSLHRAQLLDRDLVGRRIRWSLRSCALRVLLQRGTGVDADYLGHLWPLRTRALTSSRRLSACAQSAQAAGRGHRARFRILDNGDLGLQLADFVGSAGGPRLETLPAQGFATAGKEDPWDRAGVCTIQPAVHRRWCAGRAAGREIPPRSTSPPQPVCMQRPFVNKATNSVELEALL